MFMYRIQDPNDTLNVNVERRDLVCQQCTEGGTGTTLAPLPSFSGPASPHHTQGERQE